MPAHCGFPQVGGHYYISQSELAVKSEAPVRTIQQYEQRKKDINKAQAVTLLRLARSLNCKVEDLIEKVQHIS